VSCRVRGSARVLRSDVARSVRSSGRRLGVLPTRPANAALLLELAVSGATNLARLPDPRDRRCRLPYRRSWEPLAAGEPVAPAWSPEGSAR